MSPNKAKSLPCNFKVCPKKNTQRHSEISRLVELRQKYNQNVLICGHVNIVLFLVWGWIMKTTGLWAGTNTMDHTQNPNPCWKNQTWHKPLRLFHVSSWCCLHLTVWRCFKTHLIILLFLFFYQFGFQSLVMKTVFLYEKNMDINDDF